MKRIIVPEEKGLEMITEMLVINWFSTLLCMNRVLFSNRMYRKKASTAINKFSQEHIDKINDTLLFVESYLNGIELTTDNCFEQLKILSKQIKIVYLFTQVMGKPLWWMKSKMTEKRNVKHYGKFNEEEVIEINIAIKQVAAKLGGIQLRIRCENDNND